MKELPSAEMLAAMVSRVTETMFGMSFAIDALPADAPPDAGLGTVVLPIAGPRPVSVALACDGFSGRALAGAMFGCAPADIDAAMIKDSLSELVNIIAGQAKSAMGLDQALGLPRLVARAEQRPIWRGATLKDGAREVLVWVAIAEGEA